VEEEKPTPHTHRFGHQRVRHARLHAIHTHASSPVPRAQAWDEASGKATVTVGKHSCRGPQIDDVNMTRWLDGKGRNTNLPTRWTCKSMERALSKFTTVRMSCDGAASSGGDYDLQKGAQETARPATGRGSYLDVKTSSSDVCGHDDLHDAGLELQRAKDEVNGRRGTRSGRRDQVDS
jgi:hypothetical protein